VYCHKRAGDFISHLEGAAGLSDLSPEIIINLLFQPWPHAAEMKREHLTASIFLR
jgi:hypothetical protein